MLPSGRVTGRRIIDAIEVACGAGGCPVPARLASGPGEAAFRAVMELTGRTVTRRREREAGIRGWRQDLRDS
jgi:hypothetical protein